MVTKYHQNIEDTLVEFGTEWLKQKKVKRVHRGNLRPLSIVDSRSKFVINYQPDVYFILRNNKKLIFEVLDSESKKQDIIIADIIRSFLVENVEALIFIHPGPDDVEVRVLEALKTIYKALVDKGINTDELPNDKKTGPYKITKSRAGNSERIIEKLKQYADEAKW